MRKFTAEEDALICKLRQAVDETPWTEIARQVSALGSPRTRDAVRMRYFFHLSPNRSSDEPAKGAPAGRGKHRKCMHAACSRVFWSQHAGVRRCNRCRAEARDADNCLAPLSFGSGPDAVTGKMMPPAVVPVERALVAVDGDPTRGRRLDRTVFARPACSL